MTQLASAYPQIKKYGAEILFIAAQSPQGLFGDVEKFTSQNKFPFPLLLDTTRAVCKAYGVHHLLGIDAVNIARPSAFVIDRSGKIRFIFVSSHQKERVRVEDIVAELKKL